jgi:peptidoglycan/LPS O-acetylase OafA/YrhL
MQKEILPLTSLRFVAAFYVFLFHLQIYWKLIASGRFGHFLVNGSTGMSLFFILSGFVLAYRYKDGITKIKGYALSRFTRIYPAYFLAALVTLPWLILSLAVFETGQGVRYLFILFLNIFMIQAWIPQLFTYWNEGGSWSLCVEMFFYALFPSLINRLNKLSNAQLISLLPLLYLTTSIPGLSWVLFSTIEHLVFYSMPIFRLSEFIIGIVCGLLYARGIRIPYPSFASLLSVLVLFLYLGCGPTLAFAGIAHNFATVPFIALLIFSVSCLSSGPLYKLLTARPFVYLGRISYSFYSFQALVLMTLMTYREFFISRFPILVNRYLLCFFAFLALLTLASLSYYFIETKLRLYLNGRLGLIHARHQPWPQDVPAAHPV